MAATDPPSAPDPTAPALSRGDWAILAGLGLLAVLAALATSRTGAVEDSWRDLYFAYLISSGAGLPLTGPVIGNIAHLGPVWYYLLAPAFALGGAGAVLGLVGLLAGLKFPLAYLAGRLAVDRRFGLLLALALLMPGWSMFELLWPTHTSTVSTILLALGCAALWHRRQPGTRSALALGLLAGLALHAHPTTLLLAAGLVAFALLGPAGAGRRLRDAGVVALSGAVLFLPPLFALWLEGGDDLQRLQRYASDGLQAGVFERLWPLLRGLFWGGAELMHGVLLQRPWSGLLLGLHGLALAAAAVGLLLQPAGERRWVAWLLLALLAQSLFLLALRPISPFWMSYAHLPLLAGLLALGWRGLWRRLPAARWLLLALAAGQGLGHATLLGAVADAPEQTVMPTYPPESPGFMSITSVPTGRVSLPVTRLPTRGMPALGASLCGPSVVYGHLAAWADESFGVGIRAACGDVGQVALGGPPTVGAAALVGLTPAAQRASGLPSAADVAGLSIHPVADVWTRAQPLAVIAGGRFPPRTIDAALSEFSLSGQARGDAVLVVASRAVGYHPFEPLQAQADGVAVAPLFQDRYLALYRCSRCAPAQLVHWTLRLRGPEALVDVVVVSPAAD